MTADDVHTKYIHICPLVDLESLMQDLPRTKLLTIVFALQKPIDGFMDSRLKSV